MKWWDEFSKVFMYRKFLIEDYETYKKNRKIQSWVEFLFPIFWLILGIIVVKNVPLYLLAVLVMFICSIPICLLITTAKFVFYRDGKFYYWEDFVE